MSQNVDSNVVLVDMQHSPDERFSHWWDMYSPELIRYVVWRVLDKTKVDDIVAESFYRLYLSRDQYNNDEHAKRSLYVIARNCIIDNSRKEKRSVLITFTDWWDSVPDTSRDTFDEISNREIDSEIQRALGAMNQTERESVLLKYHEGKSYSEIAFMLGKSEPAVRKLTSRAIAKLRTMIHV